jgi:hypothetical protein
VLRAEYFHELNQGKVHGVEVYDEANELVASIQLLESGAGMDIRARYAFPGYQKRWDWEEGGMPHRDPKTYPFGVRIQYEATYIAPPVSHFVDEALRNTCIEKFDTDPGPVPPPLTEEERSREKEERDAAWEAQKSARVSGGS